MRDGERRVRIASAVVDRGESPSPDELVRRLCRFAVDELALSGCALVLMSGPDSVGMLAGAGRHARVMTELQFQLGEGPCLEAHGSGIPVLVADLLHEGTLRWPVFAPAAIDAGVYAEFSLPLSIGSIGIGTLDLQRSEAGMLSDDELADALTTADIARDALLSLHEPLGRDQLADTLGDVGSDRLVVHQATGMVAAQLDATPSDALARLRGTAFETGRSLYEVARDVVERLVRFDE